MRFLLLLFGWLLPQLVLAQFKPGSYVLADNRAVRYTGQLKVHDYKQLVVKDATGKTQKFTPEQVSSFRIETRRYMTTGGFHLKGGIGGLTVEKGFAEQLDSGRVILLGIAIPVGAAKMNLTTLPVPGEVREYLLQWPDEDTATPVQGGLYIDSNKQFRESIRPFFISRADLSKLLEDRRITTANLRAAVHALNNDLPFTVAAPVATEPLFTN